MGVIQTRKSEKNGIRYRALVRLKGYPPQSATFARKTDAKNWIRDTETAIRNNRHFKTAKSKKHTISEMIDRYIATVIPDKPTAEKQGQPFQLERWKKELGFFLLSDISSDDIAKVRDKLLSEKTIKSPKRSNATVKRYLAALSHAFTIAIEEWGWLEQNPVQHVRKPKEPKGRVRFLSADEMKRLMDACRNSNNKLLLPIVVLAISSGPRLGNILNLKWQDVDIFQERIILEITKNDETQSLPLVSLAKSLLTDLEKNKIEGVDLVFPAEKDPTKPVSIRKAWEAAVKEAELINFRFHDLRHTAASFLAMNGASLLEIAAILGHKTLEMVKRYAHLTDNHTTLVVSSMNSKVFGKQLGH